jgi:hypothetical protein
LFAAFPPELRPDVSVTIRIGVVEFEMPFVEEEVAIPELETVEL